VRKGQAGKRRLKRRRKVRKRSRSVTGGKKKAMKAKSKILTEKQKKELQDMFRESLTFD
jgi:hypothetical protein